MQINTNYNSPNFNRLGFIAVKTRIDKNRASELCTRIGYSLGQPKSRIDAVMDGASKQRLSFLEKLAMRYQVLNSKLVSGERENPETVINIYETVQNPTTEHFDIISRAQNSFSALNDIFSNATDSKTLNFVQELQHGVLEKSKNSTLIISELLKSPNKALYVNNLNDFVSYIKLNKNQDNMVEILDDMISKGRYKREVYDNTLKVENLMRNRLINSALGDYKTEIINNFTSERESLLKALFDKTAISKSELSDADKKELINIYKSTDSKNVILRKELIYKFDKDSDINGLKQLFARIDTNEDAAKFMLLSVMKDLKLKSVNEANSILDTIPLKKANIFFNNAKRIIEATSGEERKIALKQELENPFYEPENKTEKVEIYKYTESIVSKALRYIENRINMYKYNHLKEKDSVISFVKPPKETVAQRKIRVSNEVREVIKQKLGQKTIEKQQDSYSKNATKIRLRLLPDIFASIKETRKTSKKAENRDALRLYERINGANRKLVKYMLKKRDENGKQMFTIKDIINRIDKINEEIKTKKSIAGPFYLASDAKQYWNEQLNGLVSKYSK